MFIAPSIRPRRREFLPFALPSIGEEEIAEVVDALRSNWITTGPRAKRFEAEFQRWLGAPSALALNSGTGALHTSLAALNIGPGDEVITTTMTFAASVNAIEHVGAIPVLVDVQPDTLNIDPLRVAAAVTPRTRAILPVHYGGHPADMADLEAIAQESRLHIVEDAAHAIGARYRGKLIGSGKNPTAFSFYATKNLTTGEGGMLTGEPEMIRRARMMSLHGMSRDTFNRGNEGDSWRYEIEYPGFKYNITDTAAALGLVQLRRFDGMQERRRALVTRYEELLASEEAWELPVERKDVDHAWHLFVLRLRKGVLTIGRDQFFRELAERKIGASVHFIPIHLHPYYRKRYGYRDSDFPVAFDLFERIISIPLYPSMSMDEIEDVADALPDIARTFRR
jgi:dTDP-4-amino-4,6-dideoxygalactose transaminase